MKRLSRRCFTLGPVHYWTVRILSPYANALGFRLPEVLP